MQISTNRTVREIAVEFPLTTRIFEEFKIDYCCGGARSLDDACQSAGADPVALLERLDQVSENLVDDLDWLKNSTLIRLIDYIVESHHVFTKAEISALPVLMAKVADRHGERHAELLQLEMVVHELCEDLSIHLEKEEEILFPYIDKLERAQETGAGLPFSCFGTVKNPVRMMMMEHDTAGDMLRRIRELTSDYKLPDGACTSYTALYCRLEAFELDLHQHNHLENNLLFPRALELEERCLQN